MYQPVFIDLSHPLDDTTQPYPGDPVFACHPHLTIANDGCNVLGLSLGTHTGTHVDAPYHFAESGATISDIPLETFVGRALVVDLTDLAPRSEITAERLAPVLADVANERGAVDNPILLLHTGWARHWATPAYHDHPYLGRSGAEAIVSAGSIRVVGIDAFSPDPTAAAAPPPPHLLADAPSAVADAAAAANNASGVVETTFEAHQILLGAGVIIAENLRNLDAIQHLPAAAPEGRVQWMVSLAPLLVGGGDGAPVRAYAWTVPAAAAADEE
jgi:kynurenine formamidase